MTSPYNLPDHTVQLTLQYLLPPLPPLPPHLLSGPLRQRHLLLHTTDAPSYFCWPSSCPTPDRLISLLESLSASDLSPSRVSRPAYALPDEATLLASVDLGGLVRVVWRWECDRREWGYHDALLLPAPVGTPVFPHADVKDALYSLPRNTFLDPEPPLHPHPADPDPEDAPRAGTRDAPADYWAGYGSRSPSPEVMRGGEGEEEEEEDGGANEDAYWASYGQVHGTADSTHPSPINADKLLQQQQARAGLATGGTGALEDHAARRGQAEDVEMLPSSGAGAGSTPSISLNSPPGTSRLGLHPTPGSGTGSGLNAGAGGTRGLSPPRARYSRRDREREREENGSARPPGAAADLVDERDRALEDALRGIWRMWSARGGAAASGSGTGAGAGAGAGAGGTKGAVGAPGGAERQREREMFVAAARRAAGER